MELIPLKIKSHCVLDDAGLFEHIRMALERDLPHAIAGTVVLVGSGPSVMDQVDAIRKMQAKGFPVVAIKDAHDWLQEEGIVPDYAVAVDPQEHRWNCFKKKNRAIKYLIASQCHPAMFEHLKDMRVYLFHLYVREGQTYPPNSSLISGGTTTGLRAMTLFYARGYRRFELFGYDSCMKAGVLRIDGKMPEKTVEIICGGKTFLSSPEMASQANEFQTLYETMPDMEVYSHGEGLITTILEERAKWRAAQ